MLSLVALMLSLVALMLSLVAQKWAGAGAASPRIAPPLCALTVAVYPMRQAEPPNRN